MEITLKKAQFKIETFPSELFNGYTDGENWNGWVCPYFSFEEAQKIAEAHEKLLNIQTRYEESEDKFTFEFPDETEEYKALMIEGKKLYPIGSAAWIWEEA